MTIYPFFALFCALGGAIILGNASAMRRSTAERRKCAVVKAEARIVERVIAGEKGPRFVYEFSIDGALRRAEFFGKRTWRAGDVAPIFYDPAHPDIVYVPGACRRTKIAALYLLGGGWMITGALLLIFWRIGVQ